MELLDIVDENGESTGKVIEREDAHRMGIRHRTSHVWLIRIHNGNPQVLLQKRSDNKDSYPGCYDISSAGHIPAGDRYIGSALRELREELGVKAKAEELKLCGQRRFGFRQKFHGRDFIDNQVSRVYALWRDDDEDKFHIQKEELQSVRWMDLDSCIDMVENAKAPNCISMQELEMIRAYIEK